MTGLPANLREPVTLLLSNTGDSTPIQAVDSLGGGCINNAARMETGQQSYFIKWNPHPLPEMYACEARGLALLKSTGTVRVPEVLGYSEAGDDHPAFIVLEWLEGPDRSSGASPDDPARLGEMLAALHRWQPPGNLPAAYGLDHHNYLGSTRQVNGWAADWVTFYVEYRLRPQQQLAVKNGRMPTRRIQRLDSLCQRLPVLLKGIPRRPSLIHGDLWSGNMIPGPTGLALIDPAVSYSDREAEIAYTALFGGFSQRFYAAYQAAWPLEVGFAERKDLYNLYHLLNHLNLFGESYGAQVDEILSYYTA